MQLRKGKTKSILDSSIDSALLAVEIYNKPRTVFRSEGYITMMIIAWTKLFHAYFHHTIGDRFYYKNNNRYELIDGEKKAWEISTCIKKYTKLNQSVEKNLQFFIKIRNKIEHRHLDNASVDNMIFGECQSLLFNYENLLVSEFGSEFSINQSLVYSLQFSHLRLKSQNIANRSALSKDMQYLVGFISKYRKTLDDPVFSSQEYSIKLIQIPKISNTNRAQNAIEFVKWDNLNEDERKEFEHIAVLVKDKTEVVEAINVNRYMPSLVVKEVNKLLSNQYRFTINQHTVIYKLFNIRPTNDAIDPFETEKDFCLYDEVHKDYVYLSSWISFLVNFIQTSGYTPQDLRKKLNQGETLLIENFIN